MKISEIRRFNRYYTKVLGVFDQKVFDLEYSMLEMRILGEIGRHKGITSTSLTELLNIKKSYLSRILIKLQQKGYVFKERDSKDTRVHHLYLSEAGKLLNEHVERKSDQKVKNLVKKLDNDAIEKLIGAMATIEDILGEVVLNEIKEK